MSLQASTLYTVKSSSLWMEYSTTDNPNSTVRRCQPYFVELMLSRDMLAPEPSWLGPKDQLSEQNGPESCQLASSEWELTSQRDTNYKENQVRSPVQSPASASCHLVTKEMGVLGTITRDSFDVSQLGRDFPSHRLLEVQPHKDKKTLFSNHALHSGTPCTHLYTHDESKSGLFGCLK